MVLLEEYIPVHFVSINWFGLVIKLHLVVLLRELVYLDSFKTGVTLFLNVLFSVEQVSKLNQREFKELSFQAQIKNSHYITQHLVQRVNGAPCLGNFISGRVRLSQEDQFLGFLKPFIQNILTAS